MNNSATGDSERVQMRRADGHKGTQAPCVQKMRYTKACLYPMTAPKPCPATPSNAPTMTMLSFYHTISLETMGVQYLSRPKKSRIQGTINFLRSTGQLGQGRLSTKEQIFRYHGVSHTRGYKLLRDHSTTISESRTFHSNHLGTRGRKKKFDRGALAQIERTIEQGGFEGRTLPWEAIPAAAGLDGEFSAHTVRRALRELNFRRCIACERPYHS